MRLLIVTQAVDEQDPVLGFFHEWIRALALRFDALEVICLYEGEHHLPDNVRVHSLGKEHGRQGPLLYALHFKLLAWKLRHEYDAVFVHMNQEYLLIAGPLWKLLRKPAYLWRNHYAGSLLTDLAAFFTRTVFCTSSHSYTAKYRKTVLMPVGVDLARFPATGGERREPRSILFLARMAPAKRPDVLLEALGNVLKKGVSFIASLYGSPDATDMRYYESLQARAEELGLHARVQFHPGIPHAQTPAIYRKHDIFVNCSRSGMFDKTLFEAAASGCRVIAQSEDLARIAPETTLHFTTPEELEGGLLALLAQSPEEVEARRGALRTLAESQNLDSLADALYARIATT